MQSPPLLVTVFTPTANRLSTLPRLYASLAQQSCLQFEWIVVDDGSTDDTADLIGTLALTAPFPVIYAHQTNGGKHRAVNHGLKLARGALFFIVDSDDDLTPDAIERVATAWAAIGDDKSCAGLCFRRIDRRNGRMLGQPAMQPMIDSHYVEMAAACGLRGDKAEIFRSQTLRRFPFPVVAHENFVPEALIWEPASEAGYMRYLDVGIYRSEYLADGYTRNFNRNMWRNPVGFGLYYRVVAGDHRRRWGDRAKAALRLLQCLMYRATQHCAHAH